VKVLDFGIARIESTETAEAEMKLTSQDEVVGTPRYMAPEAMRGETATARADVYGLGAVLYTVALLGGGLRSRRRRGSRLVGAVLSEAQAPVCRRARPSWSRWWRARCAKIRCKRFADATDLSDALDGRARGGQVEAGARRAGVGATCGPRPDAADEAKATPVKMAHPSAETVTAAVVPPKR